MHEASNSRHFTTVQNLAPIVMPPLRNMRRMIDIAVPMRDGALLSANVFLPPDPAPVPLLIDMTIYRKEMHDRHYNVFQSIPNSHVGLMRFSEDATFEGPDPAFWVPHGYGIMHVDARGFGKSPGVARPFSRAAFSDFYDIIEWAAGQPWCDGQVGLSGVSYLGTSQYFVAAMKPPSLKAINPWDARTDRFRSDYLGGIPNTVMSKWIFENFTIPSLNDPAGAEEMRRFVDIAAAPRLVDDPYHAERVELLRSVEDIEVPTLIGGSISDQGKHSRDAFENFMRISAKDKWLYVHRDAEWAAYYDEAGLAMQRRFFDHFIKGLDNGWEQTPRVVAKVFENRTRFHYRQADEWPFPETEYRRLYLAPGSALVERADDSAQGSVTYRSDGTEGALFTITFDEDLDVVGHSRLQLAFSIEEGDDADLFVGLKKFDREGHEVFFLGESGNNPNDIVTRGWLRASHRQLANETTDWRPILAHKSLLPVRPGERVVVDIEIHPTSTSFTAGETLGLVIRGASIPVSELAMGFEEKINRGRHTIHVGQEQSWLQIPVLPRRP